MTSWELAIQLCFHTDSNIWVKKDKTGKSTWDNLQDLASDGWELVSVTPISLVGGITSHLIYTFKRPIEESK